jgi:hypothetical protein
MIFAGLEGLELLMSPLGGEESSKEFEIDPFAIVFVARDREINSATHTAYSYPTCRTLGSTRQRPYL